MTGARPQAPMQRQAVREKAPSSVQLGKYVAGTFDVAGGAQAHGDVVAALGGEGELGIEGGHAVDLFQRDA